MRKRKKIIAVASIITLLFGMKVNVAAEETQPHDLNEMAYLYVCGTDIIKKGQLTGDMPENVSYDAENNVLTLKNYVAVIDDEDGAGIYAQAMGDDFVIRLEGENSITASGKEVSPMIKGRYVNIEGPGSLNLMNTPMVGIQYDAGLNIKGCTINITGDPSSEWRFYGINGPLGGNSGYDIWEAAITDAKIQISNSKPGGATATNAGIDVQAGNLTVQNSEIDINLTNGSIFGFVAGLKNQWGVILGGSVDLQNSTVRCVTATDMDDYNHNMYFYDMKNADQLHYYSGVGNSFTEKKFDEIFEQEYPDYYPGRWDSDTSTVVSTSPLTEYCDHKWDNGTVNKEATCEQDGERTYTCTLCNEKRTEVIPTSGHAWGDWNVIKEADCTVDGAKMRTCGKCNDTETETIEKLGHDYVETIVKKPTCTDSGLKNQTCSRCQDTLENVVIPATGHDYKWVVTKEPTFHTDGEKTGTCNNCQDVVTERIPKLSESHEHDFSGKEEIIKAASCTAEGSKKVYCTEPECGEYDTVIIPMTAHTPGEWVTVKEATCSQNGSEKRECTVCHAVVETRQTETLPHTYGAWETTQKPTCTEAGVESAECKVCGETTVRGINPLGHDYAKWTVKTEAACTKAGEEISECTRCGETGTREIPAKGHSFGEWKTVKEATDTEDGQKQAVCKECGEVKSEIIPRLSGHQPNDPNENSGTANKNSNVPATGDKTPLLLFVMALAVSAGTVVTVVKKRTWK